MALLVIGALLAAAAIGLWLLPRNSRWRWKLLGRMAAGILMCGSALTLLRFLFGSAMCGRYDCGEGPKVNWRKIAIHSLGSFAGRLSEIA
jgi:hypothetical protein